MLQGINTRFGIWQTAILNSSDHPADYITADTIGGSGTGSCTDKSGYCNYNGQSDNYIPAVDETGEEHRRLVGIPVIDCTGLENGAGTVKVVGATCIFLTAKITEGKQEVNAEIVPVGDCALGGEVSEINDYGISEIYLYKDPKNRKDS